MKRYAALLLVLIILMFTLPSRAQDDTPSPTEEVAITLEATAAATDEPAATVEPTSELPSATPLPTATPLPSATPLPTLTTVPDFTPTPVPSGGGNGDGGESSRAPWYEIAGLILLIIAGGGGVLAMFQRAQRSPELMLAIEKAGDGVPQEAVKPLIDGFTFAIDALKMAVEAIDKIPATSKPAPISQYTTEELTAELARRG